MSISLVDASIVDLQNALTTGSVTCVDLVAKYLRRISTYDCRGISLNSIPIINPNVFAEADASDERRARGQLLGPLDGIPYTVKDSYKVRGMTVASGSPAFQDLVANEDAFTVAKLRAAGAVLIGRTNMCPMAAGGMQRGIYGRAESPYNLDYLPAAFASGSSNGSGVSTAASFAAFGMGEETVSSGRSPASNNALVAYTPSRGGISIRGNWPLYPTCDVVVPHTRSMNDMLLVLDHITARDEITKGDFWRNRGWDDPIVDDPWKRQRGPLRDMPIHGALHGVRIAVPAEYVGGDQSSRVNPVYTSSAVIELWHQAKHDLERLGAIVTVIPSFVAVQRYENPDPIEKTTYSPKFSHGSSQANSDHDFHLPKDWHTTERSTLVAYAWEEFLKDNHDSNITGLESVPHDQINPMLPPDDPQIRYSEPTNRIHYDRLAQLLKQDILIGNGSSFKPADMYDIPYLHRALASLERMRKLYFENWLEANKFDCVVFPAAGDVAAAKADCEYAAAEHAWKNGVKYSNGNRALRHLGIPTVTVPMGMIVGKNMPMGLTFCGKACDDMLLLRWGAAYEAESRKRIAPPLTPPLDTDLITLLPGPISVKSNPPGVSLGVKVSVASDEMLSVSIYGRVFLDYEYSEDETKIDKRSGKHIPDFDLSLMDVYVDGLRVPGESFFGRMVQTPQPGIHWYDYSCMTTVPRPPERSERDKVAAKHPIARDSVTVVALARSEPGGRPAGKLKLIPLPVNGVEPSLASIAA